MVTPAFFTICRREAPRKPLSRNSAMAASWIFSSVALDFSSIGPLLITVLYNTVIIRLERQFVKWNTKKARRICAGLC